MEIEALRLSSNAHCNKGENRDALRLSEEAVMIARKTCDRNAEASLLLVSAQMFAMQYRWPPAFRAVEESRRIFEELGEEDSRQQADEYLAVLRNAARDSGYYQEQEQRSRLPARGGALSGATGRQQAVVVRWHQ